MKEERNPEEKGEELFSELEKYWEEEGKRKKKTDIFFIVATVGAVIAAAGFIVDVLGILKEAGIILGIVGILITIIFALWGARDTLEGVRREIGRGNSLLLRAIRRLIKEEGTRVVKEIKSPPGR